MKLVTFLHDNKEAVGVLTEDGAAVRPLPFADMNALIQASREALLAAVKGAAATLPLSAVTLLAPIPRPRQDVICLGINYKAHTEEAARYSSEAFTKERPIPINFSKRVTEAVAPEGDIESHPGLVERLDYEAELAVIIGKTAKNVMAEDAADYIFGYTVLNDVSARVLQTAHKQWYFGKSLDGFTPIGPCIVTADEIVFPPALHHHLHRHSLRRRHGLRPAEIPEARRCGRVHYRRHWNPAKHGAMTGPIKRVLRLAFNVV